MANALIIPGVQVTVVKEVLPQQLAPSGVLGLIGFSERNSGKVERAGSWARFIEAFGAASAYSLPEARQALDNGVSELVISPLPAGAGATAAVTVPGSTKMRLKAEAKAAADAATAAKAAYAKAVADKLPADQVTAKKQSMDIAAANATNAASAVDAASDTDKESGFTLTARAPGPWANGLKVKIAYRDAVGGAVAFDISIDRPAGGGAEVLRSVAADGLRDKIDGSSLVTMSTAGAWPVPGEYTLAGGKDADPADYALALGRLKNEPDVDMVLSAVQDFSDASRVAKIYSDVISHCNLMSGECKGRIGFGQVAPASLASQSTQLASTLVSDRFVLVAPNGVVGAVAGLVGNLSYFQSPTFKAVTGLGDVPQLNVEDQRELLKGNVVPVVLERGKGIIVLRGLTTDGDQISVRRVADHSVRVMKMIGDLFIGLLNNADGRAALKQKLIEQLVQMERDGAIVPSTDGKDPSFKVDVYSSQADFALGIVRVNMAVRPVRAIDYIYATITIQV
jgi:hypothetical protein